jgi:hypothetical protein
MRLRRGPSLRESRTGNARAITAASRSDFGLPVCRTNHAQNPSQVIQPTTISATATAIAVVTVRRPNNRPLRAECP